MKLSQVALIIGSSLFLSGCPTLREKINQRFPPIDENQQRQIAIDSTAKSLSSVTVPTIAAEVDLSDAGQILLDDDLSKLGVERLSLLGSQQLLKITLEFHHKFVESDAGENATWRELIATWKPDVSGSIVIFAGIKNPDINAIDLADVPAIDFQVLPALSTIHVNHLKLLGHYQVALIADPVVGLLNKFKDNVSGVLARSKLATISIPEVATKPLELDKSFAFKVAQQDVRATVSANPIQIPYELTGVAWRIAGNRLTVLFQVLPKSSSGMPANPVKVTTFKDIDSRFDDLLASDFGVSTSAASDWVAVNKVLIAASLGDEVEQAAPCAAFSVPDISMSKEKMISIPADKANCRQDPTNCDIHCNRETDNDSCSGSFLSKKRCEIEKDAANARMGAEYTACLAAAVKKKAVCTVGQAAQQASCEALKTAFNTAFAGEVGNLSAQVSGTAQAHLCLSHLNVADDLAHVQIDMTVVGEAKANVSLGFAPRRVGHGICYLPATVKNGLAVSMSTPQLSVSSPITIRQVGDASYISYDIQSGSVAVSYSPSLPSLLLRDYPTIALTCPVAGILVPPVDISGFVAGIPNQFSVPVPSIAGSQVIPLPILSIGKEKVDLTLRPLTSESVVLEGSLEK